MHYPGRPDHLVRIFYCDHFVLPLPPGHRFPMEKYRLLREAVAARDLGELQVPESATDVELLRVHDAGYLRRVVSGELEQSEVRGIGFPWSPELVERSRRSVGGTLGAAGAALGDGVGVNLAGGTHHAFPARGEGFCVFNDVAVAIRALQAEGRLRRAAVLDLDVHQGNGTAVVFRDDDAVFTLSVHGESNYPFRKESSDRDLGLPDDAGDDLFLGAVERGVEEALAHGPELAFYVAGADAYAGDRLGRLGVSREGMVRRDTLVFDACAAAGVPVAVVMGGGYAEPVEETVGIHLATVAAAARTFRLASTPGRPA